MIERVNREGGDEAHVLRKILSEIQKRRQGKGQETYVVKLQSTITINLTNYTSHIRNELADALADIEPPDLIERIKECPEPHCLSFFWAGRDDKKACDKHVGRLRKRNNRREIKKRENTAAVELRKAEAEKTLAAMSMTAQSVIRVIMARKVRSFGRIDVESSHELYDSGEVIRSTKIVRQVTHKLMKDGYLEYRESADHPREDRYIPTQKLIDLWNDSRPGTEQQF